jgi:hypothetical protein
MTIGATLKFAQGLLFASVASLVVACAADEEPRVEVGPADDTADMLSADDTYVCIGYR